MKLTSGIYMENGYIVGDEETGVAVIIDPGDEAGDFLRIVEEEKWTVEKIINTHGHIDHIGGVAKIQSKLNLPFYIHKGDELYVKNATILSGMMGVKRVIPPKIDGNLEDGEVIQIGNLQAKVIHTPGHTPGGVCFYFEKEKILFSGDTLFQGSIGRTDLPGGNYRQLLESIHKKLLVLPDETRVYSGHGEETTIELEKQYNPFLFQARF